MKCHPDDSSFSSGDRTVITEEDVSIIVKAVVAAREESELESIREEVGELRREIRRIRGENEAVRDDSGVEEFPSNPPVVNVAALASPSDRTPPGHILEFLAFIQSTVKRTTSSRFGRALFVLAILTAVGAAFSPAWPIGVWDARGVAPVSIGVEESATHKEKDSNGGISAQIPSSRSDAATDLGDEISRERRKENIGLREESEQIDCQLANGIAASQTKEPFTHTASGIEDNLDGVLAEMEASTGLKEDMVDMMNDLLREIKEAKADVAQSKQEILDAIRGINEEIKSADVEVKGLQNAVKASRNHMSNVQEALRNVVLSMKPEHIAHHSDILQHRNTSTEAKHSCANRSLSNNAVRSVAFSISDGWSHSLAVLSDKAAKAWKAGSANIKSITSSAVLRHLVYVAVVLAAVQRAFSSGLQTYSSGDSNDKNDTGGFLSAGSDHSIALLSDRTVEAWGANGSGQISAPAGLEGVELVSAGVKYSVALKNDGTIVALSTNDCDQSTPKPATLKNVKAVSAGGRHVLALLANKKVVAWGWNGFGQISVPPDLDNVEAISAGWWHSLALLKGGKVVGWGCNNYGQATAPANLDDVKAIAAGCHHSLALKDDGTVVAWGYSDSRTAVPAGGYSVVGQATPPAILVVGIKAISAGGQHSLALKRDGTVLAWGSSEAVNIPRGLGSVKSIAAGGRHSLALLESGKVAAWGGNDDGQAHVPRDLEDVVAIAAGHRHSLAMKADGSVVGWGLNDNGEIAIPKKLESNASS